MKYNILHISNTDIFRDSRIIKQLIALDATRDFKVHAIGVQVEQGAAPARVIDRISIDSLKIVTRQLNMLPRPIRYALNLIELTISFFFSGILIRPQVVHCHDTMALPSGWLLKAVTGCKLIYDAHELGV